MNAQQLRIQIGDIFDFEPGATGELAILDSLTRDLLVLSNSFSAAIKWDEAVRRLLKSLHENRPEKVKIDYRRIEKIPSTLHFKYLQAPSIKFSEGQITFIKSARAVIFLNHLIKKRQIPQKLAISLKGLFEGKLNETDLPESFDLNSIREVLSKIIKSGSDLSRLLANVLVGIEEGFAFTEDATSAVRTVVAPMRPTTEDSKNESATNNKRERVPHPIHEDGDLLAYLTKQINFATARDFSGVNNHYSGLLPVEIKTYLNQVIDEFRKDRSEHLLVIMLGFHLRVGVGHFNLIHFEYSAGHNVWIDLTTGHLCWNRIPLTKGLDNQEIPSTSDVFRIPLPSELVVEIQVKAATKKATKLGEIFNTPIRELKKAARRHVFEHSVSSHTPTLTRLAKATGRFYYHLCHDDAYSAAISLDFSVSTQSTFSYFSADPQRLNEIARNAYAEVGYEQKLYNEVTSFSGSQLFKQKADLANLLNQELTKAKDSFNKLHARSGLSQLIDTHHRIVDGVATLSVALLALRKAHEFSLCAHTIDLEAGLVLVTDKASNQYLSVRLLPIPELLTKWLKFYYAWLSRLANRLFSIAPTLAVRVAAAIPTQPMKYASEPLFFHIEDNALFPIGTAQLQDTFKRFNLPTNVSRHIYDFELRALGRPTLVNILLGHANPGQEPFGFSSAISPGVAIKELHSCMNQVVSAMAIIEPPSIEQVSLNQIIGTSIRKKYSPGLWAVREADEFKTGLGKSETSLIEHCPFHEFSLIHSNQFIYLFTQWTSTACGFSGIDVVLALIMFDGVVNKEELLKSFDQLTNGTIYKCGDKYWVDVQIDVGFRRVYVSLTTLHILNRLNINHALSENEIEKLLIAFMEVTLPGTLIQKNIAITMLQQLCEMAADFYSLRVHGPLREWLKGLVNARTLRVEALARHHFNFVEPRQTSTGQFRRRRYVGSSNELRQALKKAVDKSSYGGKNATRIARLRDEISLLQESLYSLADQVLATLILFICDILGINSPKTVADHYSRIREFINFSARDASSLQEFISQNWSETLHRFFEIRSPGKDWYQTLNYFLKCFGMQCKVESAADLSKIKAPSNPPYSDFLSIQEVEKLHDWIQGLNEKEIIKKQLHWMLNLLTTIPERREDVATLRAADFFNLNNDKYINISEAATGTKKSVNSSRVLHLDTQTHQDLLSYSAAKIEIFQDKKTGLFSPSENPFNFDAGNDLLTILGEGMVAVSGSVELSPHRFRTGLITKLAHQTLSINNHVDSIEVLTGNLYSLVTFTGHSAFKTIFEHYINNMEVLRRDVVDELLNDLMRPGYIFIASVYDANPETIRRYSFNIPSLQKYLNGLSSQTKYSFQERVLDTKNLVVGGLLAYPNATQIQQTYCDHQLILIQYRMLVITGISDDTALTYLDITKPERDIHNKKHHFLELASKTHWVNDQLSTKELMIEGYPQRMLQKLGELQITQDQIVCVAQLIPGDLKSPWQLTMADLRHFPNEFFSRLRLAGFDSIFSFRVGADEAEISQVCQRLLPTHHDLQQDRNFKKGMNARVKFVFKGDPSASWPRRVPVATTWVSLFLISYLTSKFEV